MTKYTITINQLTALVQAVHALDASSNHPALPRNVATMMATKASNGLDAFNEVLSQEIQSEALPVR